MKRILYHTTRWLVINVLGFGLLTAGIVMMFTPGPGLLGIAAGLAILGRQYRWATRTQRWATSRFAAFRDRDRGRPERTRHDPASSDEHANAA